MKHQLEEKAAQHLQNNTQTENYLVPMSFVQYRQLWGTDQEASNNLPGSVAATTQLAGVKGEEGSQSRWDMTDGTLMEVETYKVKVKAQKWKVKYNITKSTIPAHADLGEDAQIKEIFTVSPVTYCSCPFKQAIMDRQAKESGNPAMNSQVTFCSWKTEVSKECTREQLDKIRELKLDWINEMLQDIAGNKIAWNAKSEVDSARHYLWQKQQAHKKLAAGEKARLSFNMNMADRLSERYVEHNQALVKPASCDRASNIFNQSESAAEDKAAAQAAAASQKQQEESRAAAEYDDKMMDEANVEKTE